ncbi:MAG: hypothetical protein ACI4KM_11635 [Oscillospiraceae bacterium]
MNTICPIPQELLNDAFTLIVPDENGFEQTYIQNVRAVKKSEISDYASTRTRDTSELVIYYDCTNSLPRRMDFCAGMQIEYCGELFEVLEAKQFCGVSAHHWKLTAKKIGNEEGYYAAEQQA